MDAASPNRPVMSARIGLANHVEAFALKKLVVAVKCVEILVLGTHRAVEYLEFLIELIPVSLEDKAEV